jgi:hypothetical protein
MDGRFEDTRLRFEILCDRLKQADGPNDRHAILREMATVIRKMDTLAATDQVEQQVAQACRKKAATCILSGWQPRKKDVPESPVSKI